MFFVPRTCFICMSSRCCRNISAIVHEIGESMDNPFSGWYILFRKVK